MFRASLCRALVTAASIQDKSLSLLTTLTNSLLLSFSPSEVISDDAKEVCSAALLKIVSLSRKGYLEGSIATAQSLAELISAYTLKNTSASLSGTFASAYPVTRAVSGLIQGVQLGMASGEVSVSLMSPNVQLAVSSALITGSGYTAFEAPGTASQLAYGSIQPKITLGPDGLSTCSYKGGYAQLSVLRWISNPYAASAAVKSPLLRITVASQAAAIVTDTTVTSQAQRNKVVFALPGVPAYYIALQFSSEQHFNFSAISSNSTSTTRGKSNFTLPACTLYNGNAYVPCKGCNISSYTDFNVTYGCFDIAQLCPSTRIRRLLRNSDHESTGTLIEEIDEDEDDDDKEIGESENVGYLTNRQERHLGPIDDDASAASVSGSTYGVLLQSIEAELSNVLSSNPLKLNVAESTVVLIFVGCLSGYIVLMLMYLLKLDHTEKLYKTYLKSEVDAAARKSLEDDLKSGGKGGLLLSFTEHLDIQNKRLRSPRNLKNLLRQSPLCRLHKKGEKDRYDAMKEKDPLTDDDDDNLSDSHQFNLLPSNKNGGQYTTLAVVTEFASELFPSGSIFKGKWNVVNSIFVHHNYFAMFAGSKLNQSRTILFLQLVSLLLTSIFVNTVFFGIYFPGNSPCSVNTDKV